MTFGVRAALLLGAMTLAGCDENGQFTLLQPQSDAEATSDSGAAAATKLIERDVEAPDVFSVTEAGLWDGRPSLGGVWVAHPDVKDPERVIIRNQANGKFVIGALFRRERENPGPRLQASSDAATALGILAGQPVELNVTALRRETVEDPAATPDTAPVAIETPAEVAAAPLDPIEGAAAAIDEAQDAAAVATPVPTPAPAPRPAASSLAKPFIQIGIFSVEQNAKNTATSMRQAGIIPQVLKGESNGKAFWRVIVGPAPNASDRAALLKKVKAKGFEDAYYVTN
ncbi:SPOR domain-containing protein [Nereida sp. MMG025]|uniref:SPOR domain-containing protein n=1 Tax=Nereida sp. MMG025 TaxID=2909981 RepID=UPI001F1DF1B4|nr:SPOR domain-containing protein [Nereida sp. MMG025]MCF6443761.1 SPOR domain-containing protein [Nereida sp. MMG025]